MKTIKEETKALTIVKVAMKKQYVCITWSGTPWSDKHLMWSPKYSLAHTRITKAKSIVTVSW